MAYCSLDKVNYLITDQVPDKKYVEFAHEKGIQLIAGEGWTS